MKFLDLPLKLDCYEFKIYDSFIINHEKMKENMDKKIKDVKKKNDQQMDKLVKMDIKRDKACDKAMDKKKK